MTTIREKQLIFNACQFAMEYGDDAGLSQRQSQAMSEISRQSFVDFGSPERMRNITGAELDRALPVTAEDEARRPDIELALVAYEMMRGA